MTLGQTVAVYLRKKKNTGDFREPIYTWQRVEVKGVLVNRPETDDIADAKRPEGNTEVWSLSFPKSFDVAKLAHAYIGLPNTKGFNRQDHAYSVVGSPKPPCVSPVLWSSVKVMVRATNG